jgi:DNA replication protein DnaC
MSTNVLRFPNRDNPAKPPIKVSMVLPDVAIPAPIPSTPACKLCKGAGYLRRNVAYGHPDFGKAVTCKCKQQDSQNKKAARVYTWLSKWLGNRSEQSEALERMTFQSFQRLANGPNVKEAAIVARKYALECTEAGSAHGLRNLIFIGPVGVGKTHMAASIVQEARLAGIECLYATGNDLFDALYASNHDPSIMQQAIAAGILVLDDMDKIQKRPPERYEDGTCFNFQDSKLYTLFNERMLAKRPTLITANRMKGWQAWLDDSLVSRLLKTGQVVEVDGQDYRLMGKVV